MIQETDISFVQHFTDCTSRAMLQTQWLAQSCVWAS
jgi:hypothetical protein